jgi:hypothetical protein
VNAGLFASPWPAEDGGARRPQSGAGTFAGLAAASAAGSTTVVSRDAVGATMTVLREPGEVYLLGHTIGDGATAWVERIDPVTLEPLARVDGLAGGPTWPGGIAAHADGSLHVVFGNHAHRLSADLGVEVTAQLPRDRPYNSFVTMPDGHLVTKDFGGRRPGEAEGPPAPPAELLVLDPVTLAVVASCELPEQSVARLSADGATVYAVGDTALHRLHWDGVALTLDAGFAPRYRTLAGQSHGWDAVIALGAAWFLDDGAGSENYAGTLRGQGLSTAPLHLVRVDLDTAAVTLTEICGRPGGLIANPPLIDVERRIALGYDTGNGVLAAFDIAGDGTLSARWRHDQSHGSHLLADPDEGLVLTLDHDAERWMEQLVVRDLSTGDEVLRVDSGSPLQSVLFPGRGWGRCVYVCTFSTLSALSW